MSITVILGEQRGDEGKGRFVDMLAEQHQIVARFNGGNNAGHTVVLPDGKVLKLHLVPSGIAYPHTFNVIGNGTLVNPIKLIEEIDDLRKAGIKVSPSNLLISNTAHLILPSHISDDEIREAGAGGQGSTKSGIAQVSADKYLRTGLRCEAIVGDLNSLKNTIVDKLNQQKDLRKSLKLDELDNDLIADLYITCSLKLKDYIKDTVFFVNHKMASDRSVKVLAEGAQAFLLDVDHGMYPYTTSSTTTVGGAATGLGVPPQQIQQVIGVIKAIQSHVGGGEFLTEITDQKLLAQLHGSLTQVDSEKGTTTGRIRRLGHLDLPTIKRAQMINGTNQIAITKLDWIPRYGQKVKICVAHEINGQKFDTAQSTLDAVKPIYQDLPTWQEDISLARKFSDLPKAAQNYVKFIEDQTKIKVKYIGVGPNREQVIVR